LSSNKLFEPLGNICFFPLGWYHYMCEYTYLCMDSKW